MLMNFKKIFLVFSTLIFLLSFVSAERYIKYDIKDGEIMFGGYTRGETPLQNVSAIGFLCNDISCNPPNSSLWNGEIQSSEPDSSEIVLEYPALLEQNKGYGVVFYKPEYIAWEQGNITYAGTKLGEKNNPTSSDTVYLTKARMCRAQIDSFSIANDPRPNIPLVVNISASLDAITRAALNHAGPLDYIPPQLKDDYYSLKTNVRLEIFYSDATHALDEAKDLLIEFSGQETVSFNWTPDKADDYTAVISAYVTDEKCIESEEMSSYQLFSVLPEEPEGMCYTLLNYLDASPHLSVQEGDTVRISVGKISNKAINAELYPLPTTLVLGIYDDSDSLIHLETRYIEPNANNFEYGFVEFDWLADVTGNIIIVVYGIAEDCPFFENSDQIIDMDYFVHRLAECSDTIDNDGDGSIDYPDDFGCSSPDDDSEINNGSYQCNDGIDNDNDGLIDQYDPMCSAWNDNSEFAQCNDEQDNDGDGWIDFDDPGCADANDDNESFDGSTECSDEIDNDNDGLIDGNDPMCNTWSDDEETAQCQDGEDNDFDGLTDMYDPGCDDVNDNDESDDFQGKLKIVSIISTEGPPPTEIEYVNQGNIINIHRNKYHNALLLQGKLKNTYNISSNVIITLDFFRVIINSVPSVIATDFSIATLLPQEVITTEELYLRISDIPNGFYKIDFYTEGADSNGRPVNDSFYLYLNKNISRCSDGIDNDRDNYTDYPDDFGCSFSDDDSEINDGDYECNDGIDNDEDGLIDQGDPDCSRWDDNSEGEIICHNDLACGQDRFLGIPYCNNSDVYDYYISFSCENPGTYMSYCTNSTEEKLKEYCEYDCLDGECIGQPEIACFDDSDCQGSYYFGNTFCRSDNVYRYYKYFLCKNAGTTESYCAPLQEKRLIEYCAYGCTGGACIRKPVALSEDLYVSDISFGIIDRFYIEDQIYFSITLLNQGKADIEDLGISVVIYDLGLYYKFGNFKVNDGERVTKSKVFDLPFDVKKGSYDIRIVVSNDEIRRVLHREVNII